MIKVEMTARNYEIEDKLRVYVEDKIGSLDKYLPRRVRGDVVCEIVLTDDPSGREDNRYVCEVIMAVPGAKLVSQEATINIFAAVDICEAKLKAQMTKYKEKHTTEPRRARMLARLMGRKSPEPTPETPEQELI
jgi:ribosomal subunit interface protein